MVRRNIDGKCTMKRKREGNKVRWREEEKDGERKIERKPDGEGGEKMREGRRKTRESKRWSDAYRAGMREGEDESTSERASERGVRRGIEQTRVDSDMRVSRKPVTPRFPWQRQAINQPATSPSTVR